MCHLLDTPDDGARAVPIAVSRRAGPPMGMWPDARDNLMHWPMLGNRQPLRARARPNDLGSVYVTLEERADLGHWAIVFTSTLSVPTMAPALAPKLFRQWWSFSCSYVRKHMLGESRQLPSCHLALSRTPDPCQPQNRRLLGQFHYGLTTVGQIAIS
jgi:hypothetical protein